MDNGSSPNSFEQEILRIADAEVAKLTERREAIKAELATVEKLLKKATTVKRLLDPAEPRKPQTKPRPAGVQGRGYNGATFGSLATQKILNYFVENPGSKISGPEMKDAIGIPSDSMVYGALNLLRDKEIIGRAGKAIGPTGQARQTYRLLDPERAKEILRTTNA